MAEKEYIDREPIIQFIEHGLNEKKFGYDAIEILGEIQFAPTTDVAPVKRGHWIDKPYPNYPAHDIRYCSECGWNIHKSKLRNSDLNWSYCPNCGTDMRGE